MYNLKRGKKLQKDGSLTETIDQKSYALSLLKRFLSHSLRRPTLRCDDYGHEKNQAKKLMFTVNNFKST